MGQRNNIELQLLQLFLEVRFRVEAKLTEAGVVDEDIDVDAGLLRCRKNLIRPTRQRKICRYDNRANLVGSFQFRGQLREFVSATRHEHEVTAVARKQLG